MYHTELWWELNKEKNLKAFAWCLEETPGTEEESDEAGFYG